MKLKLGLAAAMALAAGCGSRRGEPLSGSVPVDDPKVENGRTVFMQNCYSCHPGGEAGVGPSLNDKLAPKFAKKLKVRHGLGKMPTFSKKQLGEEDLDDLMAYLAALRRFDERRENVESSR